MTGHFDKNLNLRQLILDKKPKVILEVGAGDGACTKLLSHLLAWYPFELVVISDKEIKNLDPEVEFIQGISYNEIPKLENNSIGLAILDTDHNYWTMMNELEAIRSKMEEGGLLVIHDVDEFYHNSGVAGSYWDGTPYPEKEIMDKTTYGGTGLAVIDFLRTYRGEWKLQRWIPEHFGCAVLEKKTIDTPSIIRPGTQPVFAKKT